MALQHVMLYFGYIVDFVSYQTVAGPMLSFYYAIFPSLRVRGATPKE